MIENFIGAAFWIIMVAIVVRRTLTMKRDNDGRKRRNFMPEKKTVSSDGHAIPKDRDITCETQYGHDHSESGRRYIVHEEPETGYVVLNGVKRKISDLKNY